MLVYCVYVCKSLMIYIYKKKMKCYICAIAYVWDGVFVNRSQNLEPEISLTIRIRYWSQDLHTVL